MIFSLQRAIIKEIKRRRERKPVQAQRHTLSGLLCGPVSSADAVPWRSWEIVSMPGPTKASFQPPACLTCAGSALCFVPRDPRVTRGHSQGPGVKSRCLRLISPQLRYPSKSALKFAPASTSLFFCSITTSAHDRVP